MKKLIVLCFLIVNSIVVYADVNVTEFIYEEKETTSDSTVVRYLVNDQFLRIDNGELEDNFLLLDRKKSTIFSVNQEDKSILVIESYKWTAADFPFLIKADKKILADAPEVLGKKILDYSKSADNEVCHRVQIIPDVYQQEMQAFVEYQNILSGQQVKIISRTPEDMQAPCMLVDQVYNSGEYYKLGLPVQEWHMQGYVKLLRDFKSTKVSDKLFVLPAGFERYSISN